MTTGYLMKDKTYSETYFIKLLPVIGIYALAAAVYTFFDMRVVNEEYFAKLFENIFYPLLEKIVINSLFKWGLVLKSFT